MANTASSKKRARQNLKRASVNKVRASSIKTAIKNVRAFIAAKDLKKAKEALQKAIPIIDRGAKVKLIKGKTASRYISRLTKGINQIGT
jgi:small subunit ribosomal protein S20